MEAQGIFPNENDLATLIDNMRSLARQWRSSIGEHGGASVLHRCLLNPTDTTFRCSLHVYQALSWPTNITGAQAKPQATRNAIKRGFANSFCRHRPLGSSITSLRPEQLHPTYANHTPRPPGGQPRPRLRLSGPANFLAAS
jgi:hypothetical protein